MASPAPYDDCQLMYHNGKLVKHEAFVSWNPHEYMHQVRMGVIPLNQRAYNMVKAQTGLPHRIGHHPFGVRQIGVWPDPWYSEPRPWQTYGPDPSGPVSAGALPALNEPRAARGNVQQVRAPQQSLSEGIFDGDNKGKIYFRRLERKDPINDSGTDQRNLNPTEGGTLLSNTSIPRTPEVRPAPDWAGEFMISSLNGRTALPDDAVTTALQHQAEYTDGVIYKFGDIANVPGPEIEEWRNT